MLKKLSFSLIKSTWLLALLIMTSVLPARAEEGDFPYIYTLTDDGTGYIITPDKYNCKWEQELLMEVPAVRPCDGKPVVGLEGFEYCEKIMDLFFPEESQLKYIGKRCFLGCKSIWNVKNFPQTIETIDDYAFYGCTMLPNLDFGSNLKNIGISAFEKCTSLTSITLPKSLKVIREFAFRNCANFDIWGNFIGGGLESVVFEDGVDFYTNGVFGFYNNVFWGCANLSSVKLPKDTPSYFYIPMGTFGYCGNLKSIEFPKNTRKIEQLAFYRTGLESLDFTTIESDLLYLSGYYTFAACENLKTITAKGKVHFDGLYIFQDCKALETATFTGSDDDYTVMCPDIFKYCDNLQTVKFYRLKGNGQDNDMDSVFTGCKNLVSVTSVRPPEISKIGYSCFDGCEKLSELSLPQTEYLINETAFRGCTALESFDFSNVTSIGKGSFKGCVALTDAAHISNVSTIGEGSFEGCTGLTSLDFVNLTSIGSKAFTGCSALASISIKSESNNPPTVENEDAFDEWHYNTTNIDVLDKKYSEFAADAIWSKFLNIKHPAMFTYAKMSDSGGYSIAKAQYALGSDFAGMFEIPEQYNSEDVVAIEANAFENISDITGVTFHERLTSIGANAFYGCKNITSVINKSATPLECDESVFDDSAYNYGTLIVPFGSLDAYKNTLPWSKFTTIKEGLGEPTLTALQYSNDSGNFNQSFELTLTNPNEAGKIYYYIVPQSKVRAATENEVHDVLIYTEPIKITSSCTVVAYISDGTKCCEPVYKEYTRVYVSTESGLDKVLAANAGEDYLINTPLFGHYHDGSYLYASTMGNSGSSKNTVNEDKKDESRSDKESDFNQEDWVAISGLTSDFVGKEIESGNVATVVSNTAYPVISLPESVTPNSGSNMGINTYAVENFNIHAESAIVNNIWLVAPQPAEYCKVLGFVNTENIHKDEGYLVLKSAESETINDYDAVIEPLTMNVYFDAATINLGSVDGWYDYTGIVSKEGDAMKFTALKSSSEPVYTGIEAVDAGSARIYAANGNIHVVGDALSTIAVYSANGQLITSLEAAGATIAVSPGFYIVKVGNQVTKLAVK